MIPTPNEYQNQTANTETDITISTTSNSFSTISRSSKPNTGSQHDGFPYTGSENISNISMPGNHSSQSKTSNKSRNSRRNKQGTSSAILETPKTFGILK